MSPELLKEWKKKMIYLTAQKKNRRQHFAWLTALTSRDRSTIRSDIEYVRTTCSLIEYRHRHSTVYAAAYVIVWIANSLCVCQCTHFISVFAKIEVACVCVCAAGSYYFNLSAAAHFFLLLPLKIRFSQNLWAFFFWFVSFLKVYQSGIFALNKER